MLVVCLISVFETSLFPASSFFEARFNPAYLSCSRREIILGGEQRFNSADFRTYSIWSQIKYCSIAIASFGNNLYKENRLDIGYGFPVFKWIGAGIDLGILNCWVKDYYSKYTYTARFGMCLQAKKPEIDFWFNNISFSKFSDIDYLPFSYSVRFCYPINNYLAFRLATRGIQKEIPFFDFGFIVSPCRMTQIDFSINTEPLLLEYGLIIGLGKLTICYAGSNHRQLGLTHSISLIFVPH